MPPRTDRKRRSTSNIRLNMNAAGSPPVSPPVPPPVPPPEPPPIQAIKIPPTLATTSRKTTLVNQPEIDSKRPTCRKRFLKYLYNKEKKTVCDRSYKSWLYMFGYSIMYVIFLSTYTMIFLFGTLSLIKTTKEYQNPDKIELLTYSEHKVGLSATPTSVTGYPLIWYKMGDAKSYEEYISAIDKLLVSRRKKDADYTDLGPCGRPPYGYGSKPCIVVRINKRIMWAGKPLELNSSIISSVPSEVKNWLQSSKKMMWLHCAGYHSYDKEHVRRIQYYPDPPGFDPDLFPLDVRNRSPMVALQISDFTPGVSLAIECSLWYENGPSSVEFVLYVEPQKSQSNRSNVGL